MRSALTTIVLCFFACLALAKTAEVTVVNLRCEYLSDPIAVEDQHPLLSWQLTSIYTGKSQKAYQVLVASSPVLLAQNKGDYWNSGKVNSSNSTQVIYGGKPLSSRKQVYWKVMVWDEKNIVSGWSKTASWRMGLLQPADWQAKWIGEMRDPQPDSAITYPAPFFRKAFTVKKKIKRATAYVSGLGFYELYINGKKIGDQVLAPAVTNYDNRPLKKLLYPYDDQSRQRVLYNAFDVTNYLIRNDNAIGILLGNGWYNQRDRTVEGLMWYDVPKVILQLEIRYEDGTFGTILSDNSWKTTTGPLLKDGIFTGEKYDARAELGAWNGPGFNDYKWRKAILVKAPNGTLHPQMAPFDKITRILKPEFKGRISDSVYQYHLKETVSGWAALHVKGKAGSKITMRYISEEGEDYGQFDSYVLKGNGTESWEPKFTWHAFMNLEVTSPDVVLDASNITIKEVRTAVVLNGSFECSNTFLNKINTAYVRTQNANMHGSISSDCPHRERLGYTGDGQVAMESALLSYHMPQFYRKWLDDMDDARNHNTGFVPHAAPFGGGGGGPAWGSAYVIMPSLYFSYYSDTLVLKRHYAGMKQWVNYLQTRINENGLITKEEPDGWCLGDWCTPEQIQLPEPLVNTAYFFHVTSLMADIAGVLGNESDKAQFAGMAQKIKADFNKAYYNTATKTYWQGRQGADVFALAFGLVPNDKYDAVFNSLLAHLKQINYHFDTGILATPLLLKVLSQNNRDDIAYQIMNQKDTPGFGYLLNNKNSTLWEEWNGGGSHSHPMFGSVVAWFYSAIGGIKPDPGSAGMKHFFIAPKPVGDLNYCKSAYTSLYGKIRSEWVREKNGGLQIVIEVPANTSATFILPEGMKNLVSGPGKKNHAKKVNKLYIAEFGSGIHRFKID
ncbi:glycoside hydrolase family 78 protein [Mucilaginibacter sp. UR6-1]|uniref:family 78 glycoside hydrolase catalytic domain n=1 Tax=Mucilaginibacter sp. UR6-1 TaxID=1435643 RepID=UPI001E44B8E5|nr:family 78 glycoside hydrolase catalytic domain [Mucilaginibacter sp. UR6-1]MCC8407448.1 glycoside hydrolase family 78 protein [Mucilaginibacter sp. UR6-1]